MQRCSGVCNETHYKTFTKGSINLALPSFVLIGSIAVSEQLRTSPSPNLPLTSTCYRLTVVGLGEG